MAKVIIVKSYGSGKYLAKAQESKSLKVSDMQDHIVTDSSKSCDEIALQIANYYLNNVVKWNSSNNIKLHQGQMPNNDYIFVLERVKK